MAVPTEFSSLPQSTAVTLAAFLVAETVANTTKANLPVEFRAKTAADVLALLNEQLETLRQDASLGSGERASGLALWPASRSEPIEAGDTVARLEALESILKSRPKESDAA